jgi:hypothetical protein
MLRSALGAGTSVQVWIPAHPPAHPGDKIRDQEQAPSADPAYN